MIEYEKKSATLQFLKNATKFTTAFFGLVAAFVAGWVELGFPIPATAEDINKLTQGQAQIGIAVQLQIEKDLRRDLFDLRWKLNALKKRPNHDPERVEMIKFLQGQIKEIEAGLVIEVDKRKAYTEQLQLLEKR